MIHSCASLRDEQVVPPILAVDVWSLRRVSTRALPQDRPVADFSRLKVRLRDLEAKIDLERMRADDVSLAVIAPEWLGVISLEFEVDCVGP